MKALIGLVAVILIAIPNAPAALADTGNVASESAAIDRFYNTLSIAHLPKKTHHKGGSLNETTFKAGAIDFIFKTDSSKSHGSTPEILEAYLRVNWFTQKAFEVATLFTGAGLGKAAGKAAAKKLFKFLADKAAGKLVKQFLERLVVKAADTAANKVLHFGIDALSLPCKGRKPYYINLISFGGQCGTPASLR
ncbi:hypothetical protein [Tropheryma whipplei]|uniref:Secreted protein n=2 Tax=Tropheryma whipplei TaxID=2039 RepID=Q83GS0_TROWT|nr:hypothetical protein [Tropheryma whipplei]AAO44273.1 unknown [Tropheryma whipplei str. Twist]MCO8182940.1 hypothetical protein [Tropheryma whipplei]MCO8190628.1 hypothetical protein [Tropheryma whipplei]CAD67259.1 putative secreted protein [Tropheryma whipplei TW08/27]